MCDALGYHPGSIGEAFYQIGEERMGSEDNNG
jgi:hypothetical protein